MNDSLISVSPVNALHHMHGEDIGGMKMFLGRMEIFVPYSIMSLLGFFVGVAGNGLIIGSILVSRDLRKFAKQTLF